MKLYVVSFLVGLMVGCIYSAMGVRSPAPPIVALLGLLGMLLGAQVVPFGQRWVHGEPPSLGWLTDEAITGVPAVLSSTSPENVVGLDCSPSGVPPVVSAASTMNVDETGELPTGVPQVVPASVPKNLDETASPQR
jgi:XapX domain-containing protein